MRLFTVRLFGILNCFVFLHSVSIAQDGLLTYEYGTTCTFFNHSVINLACNQTCTTIVFQTPHIKQTSDYNVNSICYLPYPYVTPGGLEDPNIYNDDRYSTVFSAPFLFCFYDSLFSDMVIGSNGLVSFETGNAGCSNAAWNITSPLPHNSGLNTPPCTSSTDSYPKAAIMGAFYDLDPRPGPSFPNTNSSPPDRKIEWRIEGTAPFRRIIVSFYHIGVYQQTPCGQDPTRAATFQMVMYESTGIIDIYIQHKECVPISETNAIEGIHDWTRLNWKAVPGRNGTSWTASNDGWRFTPSAGASRFISSELDDLGGNLILPADTLTTTSGLLDIRFPNFCPPAGNNTYIVKTFFSACDNPNNLIVSLDTISISRTNGLNATATTTPATCGPPSGTITITVPAGIGTPPYTYILDGGAPVTGLSPHTFTNVASGPHTIVITDAPASCTSTLNVTVNVSGNITAVASAAATACFGVNNGSITITSATGTGPYTFSIDGGPFNPGIIPYTFTNLASGNHTILINDLGTGCSTVPIIVNVPVGFGVSGIAVPTPTSCSSTSNGTITVTALTGTAPFTFQLDGGPIQSGTNPYVFTNVSTGVHNIVIRDNFGCSILVTVIVPAGSSLVANVTNTSTACTGVSNGSITVNVLNGTAPYTYMLDAGAPQSGTNPYTFTNVAAGLHTITVTDNNGCTLITTTTITVGAGVTGTVTNTSTSCSGVSNGTIIANATSGTAPFTYQLDAGAPQAGSNPYTFTNVAAGTHTIVIRDNLGCSFTTTTIVAVGSGITGTVTSTPTACTGASNGTVTANATSGVAPFTFQLDGGAPQSGANPYTFSNVSSGSHTIIVTDNLGCTFTSTITVTTGPGVSGNVTSTATSCQVSIDGTITANATSGTSPFIFQLDGGAPQSGTNPYTFMNVASGSHTVIITDNFGCTLTSNVAVAAGPPLTGNITSAATSCSGAANGTITVTATSGTAPFMFALDGGAPVAGASPYTFNNLAAGPHTAVITDASGCTSNPLSVNVAIGPPLTTTINKTDVLCFGGSTGTITVTVPSIGTPPYQYSLDGIAWQGSNVFNGLIAGSYTVYYRESNGCQGSQPITINQPAAALSATSTTVPVICNGQSNGVITVTASGGTAPYQYSLDGGAYQSSNVFNTAAGIHNITIRDANNCTTPNIITVTEPAVLTAATTIQDASCNGGNDGVITINAMGGNSGYQYSLDGINFKAIDSFHVAPGNYVVTIKDNLGCLATTNATVGLSSNFTMIPQADKTICEGTSTQLQLTSNATQYSWTPSTGLNNTTISNPVANPTVTTQYIVTATLDRCSANDTIIVNVNAAPIPNAGPDGFICYGQSYQLQASGGTSFSWTPSTNLSSTSVSNPITTPQQTIKYTLSVIDVNGCQSLTTDDVTVDVTPPIKVSTYPRDTILYSGDQLQLLATSAGNIYNWSPSTGLDNPNIPNPVVTAGLIGDVVLYTVTASTIAGCQGVGYIKVQVYKGPDIYMPNAFTPNNDGKNDIFKPFTVGIEKINYFKIFNRWGQMIYSTTVINEGWNGKLGSQDQPSGVYVWMVQGVSKENKIITKKGTVTLIR